MESRNLIELKRFAEVPDSLERVRSYYPDSLRIRLNLGRAYAALGQSEDAISEFEKAIGINPFHPLIHLSLEKLYEKTDNKNGMRRARETLEHYNDYGKQSSELIELASDARRSLLQQVGKNRRPGASYRAHVDCPVCTGPLPFCRRARPCEDLACEHDFEGIGSRFWTYSIYSRLNA